MTKKQRKAVDNLMDNFDFQKVEKVMNFLKWEWVTDEGTLEIPAQHEIRKRARYLLRKAIDFKGTYSTGGFVAEYIKDEDGFMLDLKFVLTDWFVDVNK